MGGCRQGTDGDADDGETYRDTVRNTEGDTEGDTDGVHRTRIIFHKEGILVVMGHPH